jgi:hypothetical protein
MVHVTDCDRLRLAASCSGMPDFADLTARIEALRARCCSPDARLIAEIEDLLAEGYLCALRGDHHSRRLRARAAELAEDGATPEALRSLAREQRRVAAATRELRARLAVMREHWVALGSERLGLA